MTSEALLETRQAFDGVARIYDDSNARNRVLCEMRRALVQAVADRVPPGAKLLDLGCGPGPDAETFARRGYRVTAIDWSPEMAREASRRMRAAGLDDRVEVQALGIQELHRLGPGSFDAAYSDLGPLNCVPDLDSAARAIAGRLKRGGSLVASVIGRLCPWEIALYALRGDWKRLGLRFSRKSVPVPFYGRTVWTRYYTPSELERSFAAAGFTRLSVRSLGLLLPPPYLTGFAERHPELLNRLARIEERIASLPVLRQCGDHFLVVMRRD